MDFMNVKDYGREGNNRKKNRVESVRWWGILMLSLYTILYLNELKPPSPTFILSEAPFYIALEILNGLYTTNLLKIL